jgi:hypothetical protein
MRTALIFRFVYIIGCALALLTISIARPANNWDMIGYVSSAYHYLGLKGAELHSRTYDDIRATTSADEYAQMIDTPYELAVSQDPVALEQQLPFYTIRPLYVGLTIMASSFTDTMSMATTVVSAFAGFFIVLITGLFLLRVNIWVLLSLPVALILVNIAYMSNLNSPDALAAALAIASLYIASRGSVWALVPLALLPVARTDYVVLVAILAIAYWNLLPRRAILASAAVAFISYALINWFFGNYGHLVVFNFTLISGPVPYPVEMAISKNPGDYLAAYIQGMKAVLGSQEVWQVFAAALVIVAVPREIPPFIKLVFLASTAFMLLHFALFPAGFKRSYFLANWSAALLILHFASARLAGMNVKNVIQSSRRNLKKKLTIMPA